MTPKAKSDFVKFAAGALDKIYNESKACRRSVEKHYGLYHPPYNAKFRTFRRKLNRRTTTEK